ncbi:MAG: NADase-type glycan-binding domain-containing protein, partial [Haloechinothrix sp.]
ELRQRQRPAPQSAAELRPPQPGELVCGHCGAGNVASRKFCARCGGALTEARVVRMPWWKRLFARRTRVRTSSTAERPRGAELRRRAVKSRSAGRRAMRWVRNLLAFSAVGGGVMYAAVSPFREMVNDQVVAAKDGIEGMFTTELVPVRPTKVWAAPTGGKEPVLVLTFQNPAKLDKAIVRSGVADNFQNAHRPRKLHLVFSTGKTHDVTLADTPDPQEVAIANSDGAKRVEIHVVDVYRSLSGKHVALSEIEFFQPG